MEKGETSATGLVFLVRTCWARQEWLEVVAGRGRVELDSLARGRI